MAKVCPNCGRSNGDSQLACKDCQANLTNVARAKEEVKSGGGCGRWIVAGVVVLGLLWICSSVLNSRGLSGVARPGSGGTGSGSASQSAPLRLPAPAHTESFDGRGTRSADDFTASYSPLIIDASNSGDSNFIIQLKGDDGGTDDLVINEIGPYRGTVALPVAVGEVYHFDVDAEGTWELTVRSVGSIGISSESSAYNFSGRGTTVTKAFILESGRVNFEFDHDGDSNFIVYVYTVGSGDKALLVNEIGKLSGHSLSDRAANALYYLSIEADGEWTAKVSQ